MKIYELPLRLLQAALHCAGENDPRYYINGALLDTERGRLVSTDGNCMLVAEAPQDRHFPRIIIPRDTIKIAGKANGTKLLKRCLAQIRQLDDKTFDLHTLGGSFPFTPVDGRFPEYERVIPKTPSGEVAQFDPQILARCMRALWLCGEIENVGLTLQHNGNGGAIYSKTGLAAFCVIMPLRACEASTRAWFYGRQAEAA